MKRKTYIIDLLPKLALSWFSHYQWGTTDIQSCPIKLPPLSRAPAVWVVPV